MTDQRDVLATSKVYKTQLDTIRTRIWDLDEKDSTQGLTRQENREYDALEVTEKKILKNWRIFRTKNGSSNEAVS